MKPAVRVLLYAAAVLAIAAVTAVAFRAAAARAKGSAAPRAALRAVPVRVRPAETATLRRAIMLNGDVEAVLRVTVTPKIAGRLERIGGADGRLLEEGDAVEAGTIVAVLDSRELNAQAAAAAAAVETAKAGVRVARAAREDTRRERTRADNLLTQGSGTEQARDRALAADERAEAAQAQAEAQLRQAEAALQAAEVLRGEAVLKAPFDGVVAARHADPGALVSPSAPLLRLVSRDARILVPIPTRHLPDLEPGRTVAAVEIDTLPGRTFSAALRTIFPEVDPVTRTATLDFRLPPGSDALLKPGMHATVRIVLETHENVLAVPVDAVIRVGERSLVFVARDGTAVARTVRPGLREGDTIEIAEGLEAGEPVVVAGQQRLTDGAAVEVLPDPPNGAAATESRP